MSKPTLALFAIVALLIAASCAAQQPPAPPILQEPRLPADAPRRRWEA